jgi:hypothetical protein
MQKEFNQKLILIRAFTDEDILLADYMHQLKAYKMPMDELVDDIVGRASILGSSMNLAEANNKDALVISTRDFITKSDIFRECVRNILEFAEMECDESTLDNIAKFRNIWLSKQKLNELNKRIEAYRTTLEIRRKIEEDAKLIKKVEDFNHYTRKDETSKEAVVLSSENVNNFTIFGNHDIVICNESKSIVVRYLSTKDRVDQLLVALDTIVDLDKWVLHIDESEENFPSTSVLYRISSILPKLKNTYLYTSDLNLESNLKILNLPDILFGDSVPYMLLDRTLLRRKEERISISTDTTSHDRKFIFQNNRVRGERTVIMNKIFENNIENEFHLSWLMADDIVDMKGVSGKLYFDPTVKMILDAETLPRGTYTQDDITSYYNRALIDIFSESVPNTNTELHIVETGKDLPYIQVLFPTEKTWKPICAGKPFLGFGTMYYYKWLKSEGWEIYDNIFDYSFDIIGDDRERLDTWFKDNILRLSKMSIEEIQHLIKLDSDKIERNKFKALNYRPSIPDRLLHFIPSGYFGEPTSLFKGPLFKLHEV